MAVRKHTTVEELITHYKALPPFDRTVVQLLSILYESVSISHLAQCLAEFKGKDSLRKTSLANSLEPVLAVLKKLHIIDHRGNHIVCHELLRDEATRDATGAGDFEAMAAAVQKVLPFSKYYIYSRDALLPVRYIRDIRIAIYKKDPLRLNSLIDSASRDYARQFATSWVFVRICASPFDLGWFRSLPLSIQEQTLPQIITASILDFKTVEKPMELLLEYKEAGQAQYSTFHLLLATLYLLQGRGAEALPLIDSCLGTRSEAQAMMGWYEVTQGRIDEAIRYYEAGLKMLQKETKKKKVFYTGSAGLFFIIALLLGRDGARHEALHRLIPLAERNCDPPFFPACRSLRALLFFMEFDNEKAGQYLDSASENFGLYGFPDFFHVLALASIDSGKAQKTLVQMGNACARALRNGYNWIVMEMTALASVIDSGNEELARQVEEAQKRMHTVSFILSLRVNEEPWLRSLNALTHLFSPTVSGESAPPRHRLVWYVRFGDNHCSLQPRQQSIQSDGRWSKGRNIALKRLLGDHVHELDFLTEQDVRICSTIQLGNYGYGDISFKWERALCELAGHPLIFLENSQDTHIEIVKGVPELMVVSRGDTYHVGLSTEVESADVTVVKETPTRYKVIQYTDEHRKLARVLGQQGIHVPKRAKERILKALASLSSIVTVQSAIEGTLDHAREVTADFRPRVRLLPQGNGLHVDLLVRPFAGYGPYCTPGEGGSSLIVVHEGETLQTVRDLALEIEKANSVNDRCPTLAELEDANWQWSFNNPVDCLQMLLELKELGDGVVVEWPEGERFTMASGASFTQMRMKIRREEDWFAIEGDLHVDETLVLDLKKLLDKLDTRTGRFIQLDDGRYIALTREFRKRLEEFKAYSSIDAKGVHVHPLASIALEEFMETMALTDIDSQWKACIERIRLAEEIIPVPPSTFQAVLRDYQTEGYQWLMRLAHWGAGACLADDMGLGKTIQVLAVLLERAALGPSLVIAPTSVATNWINETVRFAPALNTVLFRGKERQGLVDELKPFDVLVCTYGLFQSEADMLCSVTWNVIVLDEAQAIKNVTTKRSQASMNLTGTFKVLTTGTPIENHLGELWNLFHFINPGLLGSLERFNQRYAIPIEKFQNKEARKRLKKLIQPFLLRRTKAQILDELPSRTEITLHVEMSSEEAAFYEALRQRAVEKLAGIDAPAGQKHIHILAEIMKLRRACCNSRLITGEPVLPSSKLSVFSEVLGELIENRHKVLVFSQFVDHLEIIRKHLEQKSIVYQYLDGSTPIKERARAIDAFQSGQGDVFLISLKAGGLGLNLTAADYVIHMDPWWNPAVEDQASDRAHRIGQTRPVTIYKLVVKNTIEEKIVTLHQHKRDLADSLLDGSDMAGRMSAEELMELIAQ